MQPVVETVRMMLDWQHERWGKLVDTLPEEALNWQPPAPETNSAAQLVRHVMAVQTLLLERQFRDDVPYDHLRSLRNDPATAAELHALLDETHAQAHDLLVRADALDMGEITETPRGPQPRAAQLVRTATHGAEHLGHGELMAQLYLAGHAPPIG